MDTSLIRAMVRSGYQLQKLRIQAGNRVVAAFRGRLGIDPSEKVGDGKAAGILKDLRRRHARITDGIAQVTARYSYPYDTVITRFAELRLVDHYVSLLKEENRTFRDVEREISGIPIWDEFLSGVKGIGPRMAGVILSELKPERAPYPSSFWRYAGLDVTESGEGRSRKREHMGTVQYVSSEGEIKTRKTLGYNPFLKSKLIGVLAPVLLMKQGYYADHYYEYRHRIDNSKDHEDKSASHRHAMALRYMIKMLLLDLHLKWRDLEGLPVPQPYHVAKLGRSGHGREDRLGITDPERPAEQ